MLSPVQHYLEEILDNVRDHDGGENASYIEKLKTADSDKLALALCTADGHVYAAGDDGYEFSIQSISKPFVYALALDIYGAEEVHKYVGVEPSGEGFNQLSLDKNGRPANPLINAGAITVNQLIGGPDIAVSDRVEKIRDYFSRLAGRELTIDEEIYESEMAGADRNMAIAHLLREVDMVTDQAHEAVASYIKQCSVLVNVKDLAVMAATLSNGGTQPITGEKILTAEACRVTQAVMISAGMYDASGRWMVNVGIPAKSGVAGGLIGTIPSQMGIASLSPRLDEQGNSVRGVKIFRELSGKLGLNLVSSNFYVAPGVRSIEHIGSDTVVELQGRVNFAAAEKILSDLQRHHIEGRLVLDASRVTSFNNSGRNLIKEGLKQYRDEGVDVAFYDPDGTLSGYEFSDGTSAEAIRDFTTSYSFPAAREDVYSAISQPAEWWGGAEDEQSAMTVAETDAGKRVVWHLEPRGEEDEDRLEAAEDTSLIIDFVDDDDSGETKVKFTHRGMRPFEKGYEEEAKGLRERIATGLQPLLSRLGSSGGDEPESAESAEGSGDVR